MPIKIQRDLPASEILENENIFVMDDERAKHQDIRPIKICILNIMPVKEDTELQLLRALSNTPLQVDVTFMKLSTHISQNTSFVHLNKFYQSYEQLKEERFDGMIITGAPVEQLDFDQVNYWDELCEIMDWSKENVTSTLFICWGAQAGLYHFYNLEKEPLEEKLSGVFKHKVSNRKIPLVRGFDDEFYAPHSRHTTINPEKIYNCKELHVMAESKEAGVYLAMTGNGNQIFVTGHPEYDRYTLHNEYMRDLSKGMKIPVPANYYPGNDSSEKPLLQWRGHSNALYTNWLNYYVYQVTPFHLK